MRTIQFSMQLLVLCAFGLLGMSACAGPITYDRKVETVPVVVPEETIQNEDGSVTITPEHVIQKEIVYMVPRVSEDATNALKAVKAVNELNPTPSAPIVNLVINGLLGASTVLCGIFANMNRRKAIRALNEGKQAESLLAAVIDGVEDSGLPPVKEAITKAAKRHRVEQPLYVAVKSRT